MYNIQHHSIQYIMQGSIVIDAQYVY